MSMKEDRAREGKKAKYRKMGFGPAMDRGEIDFGDKHPLTKKRLKNFKKKDDAPMSDERFYQQRKAEIGKAGLKASKMLTGGQAKIAAKAPPPNKIDEKDFAVLRAEKAKGRGMGLQDESKKPGKIYKAKKGMSFSDKMKAVEKGLLNKKTGKPTSSEFMKRRKELAGATKVDSSSEFMKRRKELAGATKALKATRLGKIVLPIAAAGVVAKEYLKSKMKKKDEPKKKMGGGMMKKYSKGSQKKLMTPKERAEYVKKAKVSLGATAESLMDKSQPKKRDRLFSKHGKMGGGMMKKYSKGGGADMSGSRYKAFQVTQDVLKTLRDLPTGQKKLQNTVKQAKKFVGRLKATTRDSAKVQTKMGGGMMQKPMGYKSGTMVKARGCKLGRTRPTKIT